MTNQAEFCQVVVTFDDRASADDLLNKILGERLAACAQVDGPVSSTYWWKGELETAEEWRAEFKTRTALLDKLTARVIELHAYDEPQVIALPILGGSPGYLQWMRDESAGAPSAD